MFSGTCVAPWTAPCGECQGMRSLPGLPRHISILWQRSRQTQTGMVPPPQPSFLYLHLGCKPPVCVLAYRLGMLCLRPSPKPLDWKSRNVSLRGWEKMLQVVFSTILTAHTSCVLTNLYVLFLCLRACEVGEDGGLWLKTSCSTKPQNLAFCLSNDLLNSFHDSCAVLEPSHFSGIFMDSLCSAIYVMFICF